MSTPLILKSERLRRGDKVAIVSPSWGGPSRFPHVYELGLRNLENTLGVEAVEFLTARMDPIEVYNNPKIRAEDINRAFADPSIKGVFASIGGDDSVRILPYLDLASIKANPKILMGYSDTTTLTTYLNQLGLVTFNGPSIMAGWAQLRHLAPEFKEHVRTFLSEPVGAYEYTPYSQWSNNYAEWDTPGYDGEVSKPAAHKGWRWLQGTGAIQGVLFGGCIEVFEFMKGTSFWPEIGFWDGKILFFETSEDKPSVSFVKYMVRNYGSMGVLDRIAGLLFGRARSYTPGEKEELYKMLVAVVAGEFGRSDMPIVANMDFGHTDPQFIVPLGVRAEIDCKGRGFRLLESPLL